MGDLEEDVRGENVLRVTAGDEERMVDVREGTTRVEVWEESDGDITRSMFGVPRRVQKVVLDRRDVEAMGSRFAVDGGAVETMRSFFARGSRTLADLEDWLDARGVDYEHAVVGDEDLAF